VVVSKLVNQVGNNKEECMEPIKDRSDYEGLS
jgi:hypothetical protein